MKYMKTVLVKMNMMTIFMTMLINMKRKLKTKILVTKIAKARPVSLKMKRKLKRKVLATKTTKARPVPLKIMILIPGINCARNL